MKYQKEIDTITDSMEHWKKHIVDELDLKNRTIVKDKNGWLLWENNINVPCYSDQCPLCIIFKTKTLDCEKCPYKLEFNEICLFTDEPWCNFNKNPNTKTATEMVWKLAELSKYYYIKEFKEGFLTSKEAAKFPQKIGKCVQTSDPYCFLQSAFSWADTPQGHDYWEYISEKLRGLSWNQPLYSKESAPTHLEPALETQVIKAYGEGSSEVKRVLTELFPDIFSKYPYFGEKYFNKKQRIIVLFQSPCKGIVVESNKYAYEVGNIITFATESNFTKINNYTK